MAKVTIRHPHLHLPELKVKMRGKIPLNIDIVDYILEFRIVWCRTWHFLEDTYKSLLVSVFKVKCFTFFICPSTHWIKERFVIDTPCSNMIEEIARWHLKNERISYSRFMYTTFNIQIICACIKCKLFFSRYYNFVIFYYFK